MELGFVFAAIVRRWWVIVACTVLGTFGGYVLAQRQDEGPRFESRAILLVAPPTSGSGFSSGDPNRYVTGQLSVMKSASFHESVARDLGGGETARSVGVAIEVVPEPNTDIVTVTASANDPARAQRLANAFVERYLGDLEEQAASRQAIELAEIDASLETIEVELQAVNEALARSLAPYRDAAGQVAIDPSFIDPENATAQTLLVNRYSELVKSRIGLEQAGREEINTVIVQAGEAPTVAVTNSSALYVVGGFMGGLAIGVVIALLWTRLSSMVEDEQAVAAILGEPVVGHLRRDRALQRLSPDTLVTAPSSSFAVIHQLSVRVESLATVGAPLTLAVVATQRDSGATTAAMLLAHRFAANGASVSLVDANIRHPDLTRLFSEPGDEGIWAAIASMSSHTLRPTAANGRLRNAYSTTPNPQIGVLGIGNPPVHRPLRREAVHAMLEGITDEGPIALVDGGALMDAASTLELVRVVDVVVLVVPIRNQRRDALEVVARQLRQAQSHGRVLVLLTHVSRRQSRRRRSANDAAARATPLEPAEGGREAVHAGS